MQTLLLSFILAIFTVYFSSQNTVGVTVRLANQTLGIFPLYMLIIFSLLFGFLIAYIFSLTDRIRKEKELKQNKKFIKEEEKTLEEYKTLTHQLQVSNAQMKIELEAYKNKPNVKSQNSNLSSS